MAQYLKQVTSSSEGFKSYKTYFSGTTNILQSGETVTQLSGASLLFSVADRTDTIVSQKGNLFATFKLPAVDNAPFNVSYPYASKNLFDATFSNTALSGLNQNEIIVANIPKNEYGELIVGGSVKLTLPVSGTSIVVRGSYFKTNDTILAAYDKALQRGGVASETRSYAHGQASTTKSNTDDFVESNVVYLFSDFVQPPRLGGSWETGTTFTPIGFNGNLVPPRSVALPVAEPGYSADTVVGVAYLDKGFVVLTHPKIVNNFDWSLAPPNEDQIVTGASITYRSFVTEIKQIINITLEPGEFFDTNNPTYTQAMRNNGDPVYITEFGLYNEFGELIAIAKPSQPIPKDINTTVNATIEIKL